MINKAIIVGRLGADPELRYTPSGIPIAKLNIATSRRYKDKQTLERKEETEWHWVVLFARLAEVVNEYLKKGSLVYIEGRSRTRKWQDKSGLTRYTTDIVAEQMQMLDTKQTTTPTHSNTTQPEDYDDDIPY